MGMHTLTLRLTQEEFELVSALAGQMKCTNREVFTKAIHDKNVDIKPLIEEFWKEKEEKHFQKYFECTVDEFTISLLKKIVEELKHQTKDIAAVKDRVEALLKTIPSKGITCSKEDKLEYIAKTLDAIFWDDSCFLHTQYDIEKAVEELTDAMQHVQFRLQRKH